MILAITQRYETSENNREIYYMRKSYQDVFEKLNVLLIPVNTTRKIKEITEICDGLIITGGGDIAPKYYCENPVTEIDPKEEVNDILDFELIKAFNNAEKPILGICKGIQSINVYFGGSLYQHIDNHKLPKTKRHNVHIEKESFLYNCYHKENIEVNSLHHQCIKSVAPNFKVTAISDDGFIEGIEHKNIIGVQWHPELLDNMEIFNNFILYC